MLQASRCLLVIQQRCLPGNSSDPSVVLGRYHPYEHEHRLAVGRTREAAPDLVRELEQPLVHGRHLVHLDGADQDRVAVPVFPLAHVHGHACDLLQGRD
jgi:hypothetical protein